MDTKKEVIFADGLMFQDPHEKAPNFVKFKLIVNAQKFNEFMKANMQYASEKGWLSIIAKESKKGGIYFELDTWKPTPKHSEEIKQAIESEPTVEDEGLDDLGIPF